MAFETHLDLARFSVKRKRGDRRFEDAHDLRLP
jgi:hypothetical protein